LGLTAVAKRHNCERCWTQDPDVPTVKKFDEWLCPGHLDDVEEEARVLVAEARGEFEGYLR
jgi:hypothetical protein